MKIEIKVDGFEKEEIMTLTDEMLDNDNFVDMIIDGREYNVSIDDLYSAIKTFRNIRALRIEREKGYDQE